MRIILSCCVPRFLLFVPLLYPKPGPPGRIIWADLVDNEAGYKIERGLSANGPFTQIAMVHANMTTHIDPDLEGDTRYCYRIRAFNAAGTSAYSNIHCNTPDEELAQGSGSDVVAINFQPVSTDVPADALPDMGEVYDPILGYGWDQPLEQRARGINADPYLDSFVFAWNAATWIYDLPNGSYLISLASGDPSYDQGPPRIVVEGQVVIDGSQTVADTYIALTDFPVTVTDGQLSVTIGGAAGATLLNTVTIVPVV